MPAREYRNPYNRQTHDLARIPKYTGPERRRQPRWRPRPLRVIATLLLIAAMGYGAAVLYLVSQETRLVFQAGRTLSDGAANIPVRADRSSRAPMARVSSRGSCRQRRQPDDAPWVLFLHGNAATIAAKVNIAHYSELRKLGLNVMAPEYRGFGGLDGHARPKRRSRADAHAAYDYLRTVRDGFRPHARDLRLVARIRGRGDAWRPRSNRPRLILEGAPASLVDIGQQQYPFFPDPAADAQSVRFDPAGSIASARRSCSCTARKTR